MRMNFSCELPKQRGTPTSRGRLVKLQDGEHHRTSLGVESRDRAALDRDYDCENFSICGWLLLDVISR